MFPAVNETNSADCTDGHYCEDHDDDQQHAPDCGHEAVQHDDHCDHHGPEPAA